MGKFPISVRGEREKGCRLDLKNDKKKGGSRRGGRPEEKGGGSVPKIDGHRQKPKGTVQKNSQKSLFFTLV